MAEFTETGAFRPRRSCLYMPGTNARAHEKAKTLAADVLIFDLEDSVAPENKVKARGLVCDYLANRADNQHQQNAEQHDDTHEFEYIHSPATVILLINTGPACMFPRVSTLLPAATTLRKISRSFPAMVTSSTA